MGILNQQFVRDKFDKIKSNFEQLVADGKVPSECKALFCSFFALFELVLSVLLERMTKKTSKNSSIPPSQTSKDESASDHKGSQGKGKKDELK